MPQSYLMESDYDFGSLDFSDLECFSSSDTVLTNNFLFGKDEINSSLKPRMPSMSDLGNKIHDDIEVFDTSSDGTELFSEWNLNSCNELVDITEEVDYDCVTNESSSFEEIIIPVSPDPVTRLDITIKEEECIPISESQVEIETTEEEELPSSASTEISQVPQLFVVQCVSPSSSGLVSLPAASIQTSVDKCVRKKADSTMFKLNNNMKHLEPLKHSIQQSIKYEEIIDDWNRDINVHDLLNGKATDQKLTLQQERITKRKLRMIKNRESAFLSRERKKEYISKLERKVYQLQKENDSLKDENEKLKEQLQQHRDVNDIVWSPKRAFKHTNKKVTSVMLGVLLMVTFNIFKFRTLPQTEPSLYSNNNIKVLTTHQGRSLLWTEKSNSYNPAKGQVHSESPTNVWTNNTFQMKCPIHINQTESMRIDSELRKWIGAEKQRNNTDNVTYFRSKLVNTHKKKIDISLSTLLRASKTRQLYSDNSNLYRSMAEDSENEIQFFDLHSFDDNAPLYQAMGRQRDTFYFVSFSEDHIVLPAITHNITISPKMSLLLPSTIINESLASSDVVTMMQIDCAVTDTRLLRVKGKDIPAYLKTNLIKTNHRNDNSSAYRKSTKNKFRSLRALHRNTKTFDMHLSENMRK